MFSTSKAFADLIRAHKIIEKNPQSKKIEDAVQQLVNVHQNFDRVLAEAASVPNFPNHVSIGEFSQSDKVIDYNVNGFISWLKDGAVLVNSPLPKFAPNILGHKILEYSKFISKDAHKRLSKNNYNKIVTLLNVIENLLQWGNFDVNIFTEIVLSEEPTSLTIDIIWLLHKHHILSLENYCQSLPNRDVCFKITYNLLKLNYRNRDTQREEVFSGILSHLIQIGFCEQQNSDLYKENETKEVAIKILEDFLKKSLRYEMAQECQEMRISIFKIISNNMKSSLVTIKRFCQHMLKISLTFNIVIKVSQAFLQQADWSFEKASPVLVCHFQEILKAVEVDEVVIILGEILNHCEVNWQYLLTFVSTFVITQINAALVLKDFIHLLLKYGLENSEQESLISAFLLARQACHEKVPFFLSYGDWFKNCFGSKSTSLANKKSSFSFLINFLSNIVPYEPIDYLKVHISKPPFAVTACMTELHDYISLAKTRLIDLKTSADEDQEVEKLVQKAKVIVDFSLLAFQKSNKIPPSVLEASIFDKQYYLHYFLPALLRPRMESENEEVREKMVNSLNKSGLIPQTFLSNYKEASKKEAENMLEEDEMETLDECEELSQSLENFSSLLINHSFSEFSDINCRKSISEISSLLKNILLCVENCSEGSVIVIDVDHPNSLPLVAKIIDLLLNCYCKTLIAVEENEENHFNCSFWATHFVAMIASHSNLHKILFLRIWELLILKNENLDLFHIQGLSSLLAQMAVLCSEFSAVALISDVHSSNTFVNLLCTTLKHSTGTQMKFAFRLIGFFLYYFLKESPQLHTDGDYMNMIPENAILKWQYLIDRLSYQEDENFEEELSVFDDDIRKNIIDSPLITQLIKKKPLSFEDWIYLELNVNPTSDFLNIMQRKRYYWYNLHNHYSQLEQSEGGFKGSYVYAATLLFQSLYNFETINVLKNDIGCQFEIINLLQESVCLLPSLSSTGSQIEAFDIPWLHSIFQYNISKKVLNLEDPSIFIQFHAELLTFVRLVSFLPSHLWITNHINSPVLEQSISYFAQIINTFLIYLIEEEGILPLWLTIHIFQGLSLLTSSCNEEVIRNLFILSPLLSISIAFHLPLLMNVTSPVKSNTSLSQFITKLTNNKKMIESCILCKSTAEFDNSDSWLLGIQIVNLLMERISIEEFSLNEVIKRLHNFGKKVIEAVFLQLLIIGTNKVTTSQQISNEEIMANELANQFPHCIQVLDNNHQCTIVNNFTKIVPHKTFKKIAATGLRVVMKCLQSQNLILPEFPDVLHIAILLYTIVSHLHDQMTKGPENKDLQNLPFHLFSYYQFIDITFLIEVNQILYRIIKEAPLSALRLIHQDEFVRFDEEMQQALKERLNEINCL